MTQSVPCNGCTICCRGDTITLMPGENPAAFKTKLVDGKRILAKSKDGSCVYLGKKGCRIHGRAPFMCQLLDCREYFKTVMAGDADAARARFNHPLTGPVLRRGAELLQASSTGERC